jgi:hypothetical protein
MPRLWLQAPTVMRWRGAGPKDSSVNYRFNSHDGTAFLLPLPPAGGGLGRGLS